MSKDAHLKKATILGGIVELTYDDDTSLIVKKTDYDRVFQCMISCPKSEILRDYAINTYYGFVQNSRMNNSYVPCGKCIDKIVFGIYVENDGCISEASVIWERIGSEVIPYLRVFCDGISVAYSDKFQAIIKEFNGVDNITTQEFSKLLVKHGFRDESDKLLND